MSEMNYFVTAIGTDSGKTLVSAILTEALQADYWKPVQAGQPTDSQRVRELVSNSQTVIHPEAFLLDMPASPHIAAEREGVCIAMKDIRLPEKARSPLIAEGAGGCLVPLNEQEYVIDLVPHIGAKIVLVSNHYLGSINHTLLTYELLKQRNYPVAGIIFNGDPQPGSEEIILKHTGYPCLLKIPRLPNITPEVVRHYAEKLRGVLI